MKDEESPPPVETDNIVPQRSRVDCQLHFLKRADGSCELRRADACVWCSVNGPGDLQISKRLPDRMLITFNYNKLRNKPVDAMRTCDAVLANVLDAAVDRRAHPRTVLQIAVQDVRTETAAYSMVVNAVCMALVDACVPMRHIFCGVSVGHMPDGQYVLEPDQLTLAKVDASFLFILRPHLTQPGGELIGFDCSGTFDQEVYKKSLELARKSSLEIFNFFRQNASKKFVIGLRSFDS